MHLLHLLPWMCGAHPRGDCSALHPHYTIAEGGVHPPLPLGYILYVRSLVCSTACCSAAYIVALLHDGFKLGMHERRLRFTNYVEDPQGNAMDIDWTLGRQDVLSLPLTHPHCPKGRKCLGGRARAYAWH